MPQAQEAQMRQLYPAVGKVFELTMGSGVTALGLVSAFGFSPDGWVSAAKEVPAGTTQRFMLVQGGCSRIIQEVWRELTEHGKIPEGLWMQKFDEIFTQDGTGPVGVADPSWVNPNDYVVFPMVRSDGLRYFASADYCSHCQHSRTRYEEFRWLVAVR